MRCYRTSGARAIAGFPALAEYCFGTAWSEHTRQSAATWVHLAPSWAHGTVASALGTPLGLAHWPRHRQTWRIYRRASWREVFPGIPYPHAVTLAWFAVRCLLLQRRGLDTQSISEATHRSEATVRGYLERAAYEPEVLRAAASLAPRSSAGAR